MHTFAQKTMAGRQTASAKPKTPGQGHSGQSPAVRPIPRAGLGRIQTKLAISEPGDNCEEEADRIAEQVLRMPEPQLQRTCSAERCSGCLEPGREHESVQTKRVQANDTGQLAAPPIVHEVLRSPGRPLDPATRAFMEPRFGHDFSRVRMHVGDAADRSAREVGARAYTVGHSIVFGAGQFAPASHDGRRLIAHELTHVLQQSGMGGIQRPSLDSDLALQRVPIKKPDIQPIPALAPLEAVVRQAAELILKNYSANKMSAGPVCTGVLDEVTGKIYIGLNSGVPENIADVVAQGISAQRERIDKGEIIVVRSDALSRSGGHSEPNAVNAAVSAREALLRRKVTELDLRTFKLHNIWLKGADRKLTTAPRCEHCARITRSISVTSAVFFVEGGVSGTIKPPPPGQRRVIPRVGPGGATGSVHGEITVPPSASSSPPTPAPPAAIPEPNQARHEPDARTAAAAPAVPITMGSAGRSTAKGSTSPVTARKIAAEVASIEASTRSMAEATKLLNWGLAVWNAATVLEEAAKAISMSAAIMAHGSPFWKEIAQAQNIEEKGHEAQRYYNSMNVLKAMPYEIHVEWNSPSELYQIQLNYLIVEGQLNDALESIKDIRSQLQSQSDDLGKAMARRAAALMFPVTSLVHADAFLFAESGGKMNKSLQAADASYLDAQKAIEFQQRQAQAAAKVLEQRMRQLNYQGVFGGMSEKQLKEASLPEFTFRRFQ